MVRNVNSAPVTGKRLAKLAYGKELSYLNGIYLTEGKIAKTSIDSYNQAYQNELWHSSIQLTGIKQTDTSIGKWFTRRYSLIPVIIFPQQASLRNSM